jgi:hypothetical protein
MDNAVALVQAYLRVNGYFTVTEYPVIASRGDGWYRTATDLDLLAMRFPRAGRLVPGHGARADQDDFVFDDALDISREQPDMLVAEVKEGRAELNAAASDPAVLRAALAGFGCGSREEAWKIAETLLSDGRALLPNGHHLRMAVFASITDGTHPSRILVISLGHVLRFLRGYIDSHWEVLKHAAPKDPAFGFLMAVSKAERGDP